MVAKGCHIGRSLSSRKWVAKSVQGLMGRKEGWWGLSEQSLTTTTPGGLHGHVFTQSCTQHQVSQWSAIGSHFMRMSVSTIGQLHVEDKPLLHALFVAWWKVPSPIGCSYSNNEVAVNWHMLSVSSSGHACINIELINRLVTIRQTIYQLQGAFIEECNWVYGSNGLVYPVHFWNCCLFVSTTLQ